MEYYSVIKKKDVANCIKMDGFGEHNAKWNK